MTATGVLLRRQGRSARGRAYLIRPTSTEDADALVELRDSVAAEGVWLAAQPGERTALEESLVLAGLLSQGGLSLILQVGGGIAGHLVVQRQSGDEAHVAELAVILRDGFRGERLGRALMETAVDWARAVGLRKLRLGVFVNNARAIALYRSLGFADEGVLQAQVRVAGDERDLLMMGLLLEPRRA